MPKHLTDPDLHPSWLHRDTPEAPFEDDRYEAVARSLSKRVEFPARPNLISSSDGDQRTNTGACGESSTGTGARPHSLALTAPHGEPVPVGHLSLIERIKEAARG